MGQGGGGPEVQVLGPMPGPHTGGPAWLETRGPDGGRGAKLGFSCSGILRLADTIPTGMVPEKQSLLMFSTRPSQFTLLYFKLKDITPRLC